MGSIVLIHRRLDPMAEPVTNRFNCPVDCPLGLPLGGRLEGAEHPVSYRLRSHWPTNTKTKAGKSLTAQGHNDAFHAALPAGSARWPETDAPDRKVKVVVHDQ